MRITVQRDRQAGAKYVIEASFVVEGVVEKHDVIGAIFGQTEGLFPKEFELRELQKSGKIGRIDIDLKSEKDRTTGTITAPSSLDRAETAIIAAAMETVDRIGPCEAKVTIDRITDVRNDKRERITRRAKELMRQWVVKETHDIEKLLEEVAREDQKVQPVHYGRERLTATPDISKSKEVIIVEGRADVINMLKCGYSGVIALEGVKVPKTIINLTKRKETTAFLDGDRGGDLILKELMQVAKPKYVARAPRGKAVEDLSPEEIKEALANRVPTEAIAVYDKIADLAKGLRGTLEAVLLGKDGSQIGRVPVSELVDKLKKSEGVHLVVFDGIVTGRLVDTARQRGIKTIVGDRIAEGVKVPSGIEVRSFRELK
ncbi:MAG: DNA primase DnaG [Candidatus Bathyarchaeia archaeon]